MVSALRLAVAVGSALVVGALSGIATSQAVRDWYPDLVKPSFTPPAWVFGPVWTLLYILMGVAAFLVWQKGWNSEGVRLALAVFLAQLLLNGLWSVLFFGLRSPGLAFSEILVLWTIIGVNLLLFWRVRPFAGVLLLPYELWVTFAAVLNGAIWMLNR